MFIRSHLAYKIRASLFYLRLATHIIYSDSLKEVPFDRSGVPPQEHNIRTKEIKIITSLNPFKTVYLYIVICFRAIYRPYFKVMGRELPVDSFNSRGGGIGLLLGFVVF